MYIVLTAYINLTPHKFKRTLSLACMVTDICIKIISSINPSVLIGTQVDDLTKTILKF